MYTFQQKRSISKAIAQPSKIETYRRLLSSRGLPAAGTIMKDRSALAVSMVYVLLDHFTAEEIQAACDAPSVSGRQPAATAAQVQPEGPK